MSDDARVLLSREAAPWARRPPRILLPLLVAGVVAGVIVWMLLQEDGTGYTVADVDTAWAWASSAAQTVLLTSLGLVWAVPRATTWWTAGALAVLAAEPGHVDPALWGAAGLLAVAATGSVLVAAHQRATAAAWSGGRPRSTPPATADARAFLLGLPLVRTGLGALLVIVGVIGTVFAIIDSRSADAFRATAVVTVGTVVSVDDDDTTATVELDDGTRLDVPLPTITPARGDTVEVRHDPASGRAELTNDVFDPTGALIPGVGGLLGGTLLLTGAVRARRDVRRLIDHGGAPLRLVADWSPAHRGLILSTVDGLPFALVPHPVPAWTEDQPWRDAEDDEAAERYVSEPTDDESLLAAAARISDPVESDDVGDDWPCAAWRTTPVTVIGLVRDGLPAAVAGPDGRWYVGSAPVRDPAGIVDVLARWRPSARARQDGAASAHDDSAQRIPLPVGDGHAWRTGRDNADRRASAAIRRFAALTGAWMPFALLIPSFLLVQWLASDLSVFSLVTFVVAAVNVGSGWHFASRAQIALRRSGLVLTGLLIETRVPWSTIDRVVTGPDALVIRTRPDSSGTAPLDLDGDSSDAFLFAAAGDDPPLLRTTRDPEEARRRIESARPVVHHGEPAGRVTRRPAISVWVGLAWGAAVVAGFLAG
ncbi:hypothetical protein [Oerskovia turbata]